MQCDPFRTEVSTTGKKNTYAQGSEEPPVLAALVALLEELLDLLPGSLTLRHFLEGLGASHTLKTLELKSVTGGEQVVVVDHLGLVRAAATTYLHEGLDLAAASKLLGTHLLVHLEGVALNTSGHHEREAVLLVAFIVLLDDDNLLVSIPLSIGRQSSAKIRGGLCTTPAPFHVPSCQRADPARRPCL